jgi:hypothetical protein
MGSYLSADICIVRGKARFVKFFAEAIASRMENGLMNPRLLISVCLVLLAVIVRPALGTPSPACVTESGISLCVQFDNLSNTPSQGTDFEDGKGVRMEWH